MNRTNCPNCNAPITKHYCEFCGTVFEENLAYIEINTQKINCDSLFESLKKFGAVAYDTGKYGVRTTTFVGNEVNKCTN